MVLIWGNNLETFVYLHVLLLTESGSAVCDFFFQGNCARGHLCPFRHTIGEKAVVCKHWLRGLCKKGDECEFLHEYDMSKMPECYFFARFGKLLFCAGGSIIDKAISTYVTLLVNDHLNSCHS